MGRMSSLHSPTALTAGISNAPLSANGDTTNVINGATIDLHGKRGVVFVVAAGALTNDATVSGHLQTNDLPLDPANGNWTNVNSTLYANAAVASVNANSAGEMSYIPAAGGSPIVRAVRTVDNNVALAAVAHFIF